METMAMVDLSQAQHEIDVLQHFSNGYRNIDDGFDYEHLTVGEAYRKTAQTILQILQEDDGSSLSPQRPLFALEGEKQELINQLKDTIAQSSSYILSGGAQKAKEHPKAHQKLYFYKAVKGDKVSFGVSSEPQAPHGMEQYILSFPTDIAREMLEDCQYISYIHKALFNKDQTHIQIPESALK